MVAQLNDVDEYSLVGLMCNAVNAALKTNTSLVADDRAIQRLAIDGLRRGTTLELLSLLREAGVVEDSKYEECYLKMLRWNCLFLPIDEFVLKRVLARTPIQSKDAGLIVGYYDGAFCDAGLSAVPYNAGSIDSEAFRYYVDCNKALIRVLLNLWSDPSLDSDHKVTASEYVRDALWRKPEQLLRLFPGRELADSLQAIWHIKVILSLEQEDPTVVAEFLKWYMPEWLNPEANGPTSIGTDVVSSPTDNLDNVVSRAISLRERLSSVLPQELLDALQ